MPRVLPSSVSQAHHGSFEVLPTHYASAVSVHLVDFHLWGSLVLLSQSILFVIIGDTPIIGLIDTFMRLPMAIQMYSACTQGEVSTLTAEASPSPPTCSSHRLVGARSRSGISHLRWKSSAFPSVIPHIQLPSSFVFATLFPI